MKTLMISVMLIAMIGGTPEFQHVAHSQTQEPRPDAEGKERTSLLRIRIEIEGNKSVPTQELTETLSKCLSSAFKAQRKFTADAFKHCSKYDVLNFLRGKGYLQAAVNEPKLSETEHEAKVVMTVDEGTLYRIGEVKIQGAKVFSPERIMEVLDFRTGEIANSNALMDGLSERLKKGYAGKGYIRYDYEVQTDFKTSASGEANEGIVDLTITINEGQQFTIRKIEFAGNEITPDDVLRRKLLIREGRIFNQELYEGSLKRLNQSGLFEEVTEKDVSWRTDDETPELDLIIRVKEKEPF